MRQPSSAKVWSDDRDVCIALQGDLAASARHVLPLLRHRSGGLVTLDLTAVTTVDGAGLEHLIAITDLAAESGARVRYGDVIAPRGELVDLSDEREPALAD